MSGYARRVPRLPLVDWESTWALRANPSSGNLHPTEGYALLPAVCDVSR
jgi:hypothetical protein